MENFVLAESNFLLFASRYYVNPICLDIKEFKSDLRKIGYVIKLFQKYKKDGDLKERLILNHLISFYNCFEPTAATKILFFKMPREYWPYLKPFLLYLNYLPDKIYNVEESPIDVTNILMDMNVINRLRNL